MRFRRAVLCALSLGLLSAADSGLTQIRHVYLLPMNGGLDQYLANELTNSGRYQVVADPKHADALLTDQLGEEFESRLDELYPPPEPPLTPEEQKKKEEEQQDASRSVGSMMSDFQSGPRRSSFSRGRGNVFLVDRESRRVIWSTYLRPRSTRPDDLHRVADKIVERLDSAAKREVKNLQRMEESAGKAVPAAPAPDAVPPPAAPAPAPQPTPEPAPAPPAAPAPAK